MTLKGHDVPENVLAFLWLPGKRPGTFSLPVLGSMAAGGGHLLPPGKIGGGVVSRPMGAGVQAVVVGGRSGPEGGKGDGQPGRSVEIRGCPGAENGDGALNCCPSFRRRRQAVPGGLIPLPDQETAGFQMGQKGILPGTVLEKQIVAPEVFGGAYCLSRGTDRAVRGRPLRRLRSRGRGRGWAVHSSRRRRGAPPAPERSSPGRLR